MIKSIGLKNFKCFEKQDFAISPLTLLTGVNGSGKSTAIQSLLAIRQSYTSDLLKETGLSLNGELVSLGKATGILFEDAQEEVIEISVNSESGVKSQWAFEYHPENDVLNLLETSNVDKKIYEEPLFDDHFQYLTAERIGPRVSYRTSDFNVSQHRRLGSQGEFAAHYLSRFGEETVSNTKLHHPLSISTLLKGQVEAWLSEVTPGTRMHTTHHRGMDLVNLEYSFAHGNTATKPLRSTNVGFGITYTLPILLAVLSARIGDLIIVENPEAHLHPRGQRKLGEFLTLAAESGVQIIVESHSDHLLNGVRLAVYEKNVKPETVQIHFFSCDRTKESKASHVISPQIDQAGRLDSWPEGFFDEWDNSLERLLTAKK